MLQLDGKAKTHQLLSCRSSMKAVSTSAAGRESLDCALALQELIDMGVDNIITFDAHDPRVQNAIPLNGFETVQPAYQFIKGLFSQQYLIFRSTATIMMVISPDEGGMGRAIYMANVLGSGHGYVL